MPLVSDARTLLASKTLTLSLFRVVPAISVDWSLSVIPAILGKLSSASRLLLRHVRRFFSMTRVLWVPFTEPGETF